MISDLNDLASEFEQARIQERIESRKDNGPPPCGECHYCGEPLNDGRRFCDAECRDDWQRDMDALRRNRGTM